jgi:glycerophosphoryl diester phosphodiesterase
MKGIKIIAHRGAPYLARENTLRSFQKALSFPIDMIELDVRATSDQETVVFHNSALTHNPLIWLKEKNFCLVNDFALSDLKHKFADKNIPTLDDTIRFLKNRIKVNLHIKALDAVEPTFKILEQYNFKENVLISAFSKEILNEARARYSKIPIAILCWVVQSSILKFAKEFKINYIHPCYLFLTKKQATEIKNSGFGLNVWMVNSERAAKRMLDLRVDGIITDRPNLFS